MEKPIVSCHGAKGGRFLDGVYTTRQNLSYIVRITIVQDTGIISNHDMVISKFDLGIEKFEGSILTDHEYPYDDETWAGTPNYQWHGLSWHWF